jgi:hypothetical protein
MIDNSKGWSPKYWRTEKSTCVRSEGGWSFAMKWRMIEIFSIESFQRESRLLSRKSLNLTSEDCFMKMKRINFRESFKNTINKKISKWKDYFDKYHSADQSCSKIFDNLFSFTKLSG